MCFRLDVWAASFHFHFSLFLIVVSFYCIVPFCRTHSSFCYFFAHFSYVQFLFHCHKRHKFEHKIALIWLFFAFNLSKWVLRICELWQCNSRKSHWLTDANFKNFWISTHFKLLNFQLTTISTIYFLLHLLRSFWSFFANLCEWIDSLTVICSPLNSLVLIFKVALPILVAA